MTQRALIVALAIVVFLALVPGTAAQEPPQPEAFGEALIFNGFTDGPDVSFLYRSMPFCNGSNVPPVRVRFFWQNGGSREYTVAWETGIHFLECPGWVEVYPPQPFWRPTEICKVLPAGYFPMTGVWPVVEAPPGRWCWFNVRGQNTHNAWIPTLKVRNSAAQQ